MEAIRCVGKWGERGDRGSDVVNREREGRG